MADILSFSKKLILAKTEVTYGVDPTPTGAANSILAINGQIQAENDVLTREITRAYFGARPFIQVNERIRISFDVELAGSGAVDTVAAFGPLVEACAFAETINVATDVRYNPITDALGSIAFYFWINDYKFIVLGARGNLQILQSIGNFSKLRFEFTGLAASPADVVQETPVYTAFRTPIGIEEPAWVFIADTVNADCVDFQFNMNNQVEVYEGSEQRMISIVERNPSGEFTIFAPDIATKDWYAVADAEAPVAASSTVGTVAGDIVAIEGINMQLQKPQQVDIRGAHGLRIPFVPIPSTGNDELEIVTK